ncbi:glutamate decarboxylase [Cellulosimicrobium composti]|uniref:Glutamate decarboxylase n=1 Tax=Cellulosimicrobium composti TaxID=2672572 RepID=A0A6N7ZDA0_9MICO|nr:MULTISPECIES: glutamate decarboxylase [Cellulosimicrobium]TWG85485.1 glutamate decarboxylase [Cellulosimicrobium cellulans J34]SMF25629.1 glutamate decarboxylase [Cellulosimicrobium cellulans J1]KFD43242.1 glutamate decarboxylase [Cellulosimicrobium sp. MM]MTG87405.1 glutamate decarboxylase [Cellulosimicrobium composti]NDO88095.1 glutamate decarboxylase [Cellulosimicrobium composti]
MTANTTKARQTTNIDPTLSVNPVFVRPGEATEFDKFTMPAGPSLPETAYQIVHDEAILDGNSRLNLATFVSTWMDDHALKLYSESADKNMIDKDEYPATAAIEDRCWRILADLWHVPDPTDTIGTSAIGSSEACMLGGLALKRLWQEKRKAEGKSTERPNLIMSAAVQVVWEKFCNYWDIEPRYVPVSREHLVLDGYDLENYVDENTIGVVAILGQTFTGLYDPVEAIAKKLDEIEAKTGLDVKIHVDGASGAMVAPFCQPDLVWDFQIDRVNSISTSGHKYGLVYPGVGWVVWRNTAVLPESMIFHVSYLGGDMPTLALNFSRPGAQVLLQYYQFLRLGREGYREVQQNSIDVATYLSSGIAEMGPFELMSKGDTIPVFAWILKDGYTDKWSLYDLADRLRMKGWLVPAYPMADDMSDVVLQRIVVKVGLSRDLASALLADIKGEVQFLDSLDAPLPREASSGSHFHH